jgi:hypothetical protein
VGESSSSSSSSSGSSSGGSSSSSSTDGRWRLGSAAHETLHKGCRDAADQYRDAMHAMGRTTSTASSKKAEPFTKKQKRVQKCTNALSGGVEANRIW